jgi:glucokinase
MSNLAIGVDFGGTKIACGLVDTKTGRLVGTTKKKTRVLDDSKDVQERLQSTIDELLAETNVDIKDISGIGIGSAGMIDRKKGVLLLAPNLGVSQVPITEPLSKHYNVPCRLGNDVEVGTLGELEFGAGRQCDSFVCIFIGTGIGSGIVCDGKQYLGATGTAGEIGHTIVVPDGRKCGCGGAGCLETYASRTAVAKEILAGLDKGFDSAISDKIDLSKGIIRSKALAHAVESKDELVTHAITKAAQYMGIGLASLINFYNPQRIILGGGLIEAVALYLDVAIKETKLRVLSVPGRKLDIVKAELGDFAGIIGAAMLMKNHKNG